VLHVGYESMQWTGADNGSQGNGTKDITKQNLLKKFPELKPAFEKGKLVCDKYNEVEQDILNHIHDKDIKDEDFIKFTPRIRTAYIQAGKRLFDKMWDVCNYDQRLMYVNTGNSIDLTPHQKQSVSGDKKFMENYKRMLKIRVDVKIKQNLKLTHDEMNEASKNPELVQKTMEDNKRIIEQLIKNGQITANYCNVKEKNIWFKIPVKFPETMGGGFYCGNNHLTSLEGCPQSVGGNFECDHNTLTSLEGCPQSVGGKFDCEYNALTSLQDAPQSVGGNFLCSGNRLTSLEGCPQSVHGEYFRCGGNQLTSLQGAPQSVAGDFNCGENRLTSLQGAPQIVRGHFYCASNHLTSLEGCPQSVRGDFKCFDNQLTSLQGAPQSVGGDFSCTYNRLTSLEGCPQSVRGDFHCSDQKNGHKFTTAEVRAVCKVKGTVFV
jgi:hypothetical protein